MPLRFVNVGGCSCDAHAVQAPAPQAPPLSLCWLRDDRVRFERNGDTTSGVITACNRRTVDVQTPQGGAWRVSRALLRPHDAQTRKAIRLRQKRLGEIEAEAVYEMNRHGLAGWRFGLDGAARRGGMCDFRNRSISISVGYALAADDAEVSQTILHEIAHGLVGPKHRHGAVWRKMAQSIGYTGAVRHSVVFSPPRWEGSCPCGVVCIQRIRRNRLRCRACGQELAWRNLDGIAGDPGAARPESTEQ